MARIRLGPFLGANLALRPKLLPNEVGVMSLNHWPDSGDLRPWREPLTAATAPLGTKTLFILPRESISEPISWLKWQTVVHATRGLRAQDTARRTYYTGSGAPKVTSNVLALAGEPFPTSYRDLGVPKMLTPPTVTQTAAGTGDDGERFYALTYVTDWDEEGMPIVVGPITCKPNATFDITNIAPPPSGAGESRGINRIRVYRTQAGDTGAGFFFLRELLVATSTTDDARALNLASPLPSTNWAMPPADLKGLIGLWNGIMAGISGNSVRYCEANKPYAWPVAYETLLHDTPVALVAFERSLIVLTTGRPRLIAGSAPEAMDDTPIEFIAACVSPQSAVSMGHGVCWATADGLAYVGKNGPPRHLTDGVMSPDAWKALNPATIIGGQYMGRYFGFYDSGAGLKGFHIDPMNPADGMRFISVGFSAVHYDELSEEFYVLDGTDIRKWNAGAANMTASFKSKVYRMPAPINMAYAEVIADAYPATFKLYADARPVWTKTVTSKRPFTLPSGYVADDYQVEVSTATDITGLVVADSIKALAET